MDLVRHGIAPLWNPLSFSGYPLLANWQSAPFYPLNALMLIFGNIRGFGFMVFLQPILAAIFMYLFLKQLKLSNIASMFGALVSAYSGFVMVYLEYATIGQIMIWLPLILYLFEKYFEKRQIRFLAIASICLFPVLTGGFFQPAFYVILIASLYWLFRCLSFQSSSSSKRKLILLGATFFVIGTATAALQLAPTFELLKYSIRALDHNIVEYHYGLLPIKNLVSFLAPDFFGNPVTGNYWGSIQYQEATGYFSGIALALVIAGVFSKKRDWRSKLFLTLFFGSILLAFDNPISRLVYQLRVPLLSTGYASRWLIITAFSGAFLSASFVERIDQRKLKFVLLALLGILILIYGLIWKKILPIDPANASVALRNLLLPISLLGAGAAVAVVVANKNLAKWLLLALVAFDLGRFTIKFTPFSDPGYTTRSIPVFEYIKSQTNIDRVISEGDPILPANTWMYSGLYSPTGYDPLLLKDYATFFHALNIGKTSFRDVESQFNNTTYTRYLNLANLDSPLIDLVGAKYLLAVKYDPWGKIRPWGNINQSKLNPGRYKPVFEDGESVVLQNQTVLPRISLFYLAETETDTQKAIEDLATGFDFKNKLLIAKAGLRSFDRGQDDKVELVNYSADRIEMQTTTQNGAYLFLTDTYYPGWQVNVNGVKGEILRADGVFRAVEVPKGFADVEMVYSPDTFKFGTVVSLVSLATLLFLVFKRPSKKGTT